MRRALQRLSMTNQDLIERITRSLAYMLRHQPEEFDLRVDQYGWADLGEVVHALTEKLGEPIEAADVQAAVDSGDRRRYEVREDKVRALYGHSIPIEPGEPSEPPEAVYVGVSRPDAERARLLLVLQQAFRRAVRVAHSVGCKFLRFASNLEQVHPLVAISRVGKFITRRRK